MENKTKLTIFSLLMVLILPTVCASEESNSRNMTTAERLVSGEKAEPPKDTFKERWDSEREKAKEEKEANRIVYELPPNKKFVSASWSHRGGLDVVYREVEEGEDYRPTVYYVDTQYYNYKVVEK